MLPALGSTSSIHISQRGHFFPSIFKKHNKQKIIENRKTRETTALTKNLAKGNKQLGELQNASAIWKKILIEKKKTETRVLAEGERRRAGLTELETQVY